MNRPREDQQIIQDIAAAYKKTPEEIVKIIKDSHTGKHEDLKAFGIIIDNIMSPNVTK